MALSIDRYDAITHPMNFSGSWKRAKILVLSAWALSAIFSTPQFILYEETQIQGKHGLNHCCLANKFNLIYNIFSRTNTMLD